MHRLPSHTAGQLPGLADRFSLRISDEAQAAIDTAAAQREQNRAAATALQVDPVPVPGLAKGLPLKPQQYPVVRFARQHRRILIGDDMGWGKTASSLATVAADGAYPAVVVCRPSLRLNWVAEIRRFFPASRLRSSRHDAAAGPGRHRRDRHRIRSPGRQAAQDRRRRQGVRLGASTDRSRAEGTDHR